MFGGPDNGRAAHGDFQVGGDGTHINLAGIIGQVALDTHTGSRIDELAQGVQRKRPVASKIQAVPVAQNEEARTLNGQIRVVAGGLQGAWRMDGVDGAQLNSQADLNRIGAAEPVDRAAPAFQRL